MDFRGKKHRQHVHRTAAWNVLPNWWKWEKILPTSNVDSSCKMGRGGFPRTILLIYTDLTIFVPILIFMQQHRFPWQGRYRVEVSHVPAGNWVSRPCSICYGRKLNKSWKRSRKHTAISLIWSFTLFFLVFKRCSRNQSPNFPNIEPLNSGSKVLIGGIETCIKKTATITTASNEEEAVDGWSQWSQHDPSLGMPSFWVWNCHKDHVLVHFFGIFMICSYIF